MSGNLPPSAPRQKPWSIITAVAVLCGVVIWRYRMFVMDLMPACTFHRVTGLLCPGCGGRRSVAALGRGDLGYALQCNLLIYPLGLFLFWLFYRLVRDEWSSSPPRSIDISHRAGWAICWSIAAFWILRNVPVWPFTLLAPG